MNLIVHNENKGDIISQMENTEIEICPSCRRAIDLKSFGYKSFAEAGIRCFHEDFTHHQFRKLKTGEVPVEHLGNGLWRVEEQMIH